MRMDNLLESWNYVQLVIIEKATFLFRSVIVCMYACVCVYVSVCVCYVRAQRWGRYFYKVTSYSLLVTFI